MQGKVIRRLLLAGLAVVLLCGIGGAWLVSPGRMLSSPDLTPVLDAAIRGVPGITGTDSVVFGRRALRSWIPLWPSTVREWPASIVDSVAATKLVVAQSATQQSACTRNIPVCPIDRHITVAVSVPRIVGKFATLEAASNAREADGGVAYNMYAFLLHRGGNGWHVVRQRVLHDS